MIAIELTKIIARLPDGWIFRLANGVELGSIPAIKMDSLYFAVPDIHGASAKVHAVIGLLEQLRVSRAVFLGDYIDRMPGSEAVVNMIKTAQDQNPYWKFLRGNHEQMFIDAFATKAPMDIEGSFYSELGPCQREAHAAFFARLPIYHECKNLIFVHGGVSTSFLATNIGLVPVHELLWSYSVSPRWKGKKLVRGHQSVTEPVERENHISLETGGWKSDHAFCVAVIVDQPIKRQLLGWFQLIVGFD